MLSGAGQAPRFLLSFCARVGSACLLHSDRSYPQPGRAEAQGSEAVCTKSWGDGMNGEVTTFYVRDITSLCVFARDEVLGQPE